MPPALGVARFRGVPLVRGRAVRLATAAALVAGLTGCGGAAGTASVRTAEPGTVTAAPATAPAAQASSRSPSTPAPPTRDQLLRVLIGEGNMPDGWLTNYSSEDGSPRATVPGDSPCDRLSALLNPTSGLIPYRAHASLMAYDPAEGGKAYAILAFSLTSMSAEDAARFGRQVRAQVPRCPEERGNEAGIGTRMTFAEVPGPALGEESIRVQRVTRLDDGRAFSHGVVMARVGVTWAHMVYVNLTGPDTEWPDETLMHMQMLSLSTLPGTGS